MVGGLIRNMYRNACPSRHWAEQAATGITSAQGPSPSLPWKIRVLKYRMDSKDTSATGRHGADLSLMRLGREMRRRVESARVAGRGAARCGRRACRPMPCCCGCRPADCACRWPARARPIPPGDRRPNSTGCRSALAALLESSEGRAAHRAGRGAGCQRCRLLIVAGGHRHRRAHRPGWCSRARCMRRASIPGPPCWAQVQALRLARRLMHEVDALTGHLSRAGLQHGDRPAASRLPVRWCWPNWMACARCSHTARRRGRRRGHRRLRAAAGRAAAAGRLAGGAPRGRQVRRGGARIRCGRRSAHRGAHPACAGQRSIIEGEGAARACPAPAASWTTTSRPNALEQALAGRRPGAGAGQGARPLAHRDPPADDATMIRRQGRGLRRQRPAARPSPPASWSCTRSPSSRCSDSKHPLGFELLLRLRVPQGTEEGVYPVQADRGGAALPAAVGAGSLRGRPGVRHPRAASRAAGAPARSRSRSTSPASRCATRNSPSISSRSCAARASRQPASWWR